MLQISRRRFALAATIALTSAAVAHGVDDTPVPDKLRIYTAGNSFHMWLPAWLTAIENAAKMTPHEQIGVSFMASAWVKEHWDRIDATHQAKPVVESGKLDVLTLGGMHTPDEGIDAFATLGIEHNPKLIVTYQEFWLPYDHLDYPLTRKNFFGDSATALRPWKDTADITKVTKDTANYDIPTADQLDKLHEPYFKGMDEYIAATNKKLGRSVVRVVPVGQAVLALRRKVIAGEVPTIDKQSALFIDNLGHPGDAIRALAGYCHFIVLHHKDPRGLPLALFPFVQREAKFNQDCNLILQQIAWDAVTAHPLSGFQNGKAN